MRVSKVEVRTFKTKIACVKVECSGEYEFSGTVVSMNGIAIYEHQCSVCRDVQNFDIRYPQYTYEEI